MVIALKAQGTEIKHLECKQMSFPYAFTVAAYFATFRDNDDAVEFLMERGVLKSYGHCERCLKDMHLQKHGRALDHRILRCCGCKATTSCRANTFFEKMKCTAKEFILFLYFWVNGSSIDQLVAYTGITKKTAIDYANFLREISSWKFSRDDQKLGGVGHIVQIDESLIYRPKYNRGSGLFREQRWVFGIYDTVRKVGAAFFVEDRSAETLLPLIERWIEPGSEIHSDQWPAYIGISNIPVEPRFIHRTVNHSQGFIDHETGVHTNNVEAYWSSIKRVFKRMYGTTKNHVPSYIDFHMYKQRYGPEPKMIFDAIIAHIEEKYRYE